MKNIIYALFSLLLCFNASFALASEEIPDEFKITEHWISLTTSYDVETKTRKLGTLYRKFFSFLLTYDFFDPFDNKIATAQSRFFSLTAHFDIYDNKDSLIGMAEERLFSFFTTFDIYARDASTKLVRATMNFWGTTFTIYDPLTDQEMAIMHRPFFRMKNDWTIKITNKELYARRHIDSRLLMTVLAFQGDKEVWENNFYNSIAKFSMPAQQASNVTPNQISSLQNKLQVLSKEAGLLSVMKPNQDTMEAIVSELDNDYKNLHGNDDANQTDQEKFNGFTNYCLNLLESGDVSEVKKKAIIFLLKMRLEGERLIDIK